MLLLISKRFSIIFNLWSTLFILNLIACSLFIGKKVAFVYLVVLSYSVLTTNDSILIIVYKYNYNCSSLFNLSRGNSYYCISTLKPTSQQLWLRPNNAYLSAKNGWNAYAHMTPQGLQVSTVHSKFPPLISRKKRTPLVIFYTMIKNILIMGCSLSGFH